MKKSLLFLFLFLSFQVSNAGIVVLNGLTHVHQSASGQLITGVIKLKNTDEKEQRVIIYFNDLLQECGKETVLTAEATHKNSIKNWLSTNVNEHVFQANEEYELIYTINVPNDVAFDGSYWGILMVEIEKPIKEDELEYGVKLESKVRYAIQIIADINEVTPSELEFYDIKIEESDGNKILNVELKNLGAFYVEPTLILEVFNANGEQQKKEEVKFKKVYPNSCKGFTLDISGLPKGAYTAVLVADYGENIYSIDLEFENK
ncbi:MAG: hypothetical protein GZ086_05635 [Gelidibacter sp.]|nr:hypothetical protein [Gelidibacter sp.]